MSPNIKKAGSIEPAFLLVALTLLTAFQLGLFTPYNYFTAIRDVHAGKIQLIEYGEPLLPTTDSVIHKLEDYPGVKTVSLGRVITTHEINGIKQYNYVMEELLISTYGISILKR